MKFITLVPTERNDGSAVTENEMQEILLKFTEEFGGATIEGPVDGRWVDAGQIFKDRCLRVTISCDNDRLDDAKQLVLTIGRQLGQLAVYFEVVYYDGVQILRVQD